MASEADLGRGGAPRPERRPAGEAQVERNRGFFRAPIVFAKESIGELKKVEWPGQNQVIQGTIVVLVACLIVGVYLWVNDQVWKHFVSSVLLGQ
jgi:preprotein translocase subunit SecE